MLDIWMGGAKMNKTTLRGPFEKIKDWIKHHLDSK
jgi:hypothetical protein